MTTLPSYIVHQMKIDNIFFFSEAIGEPTKENAHKWLDQIDSDLSPENLTCDGMLIPKVVDQKIKELNEARQFIVKLIDN